MSYRDETSFQRYLETRVVRHPRVVDGSQLSKQERQTQLLILPLCWQLYRDLEIEGARGNIQVFVKYRRDLGVLERGPCREAIVELKKATAPHPSPLNVGA